MNASFWFGVIAGVGGTIAVGAIGVYVLYQFLINDDRFIP